MSNKRPDVVTLKNVRLYYPHLFEAHASNEDASPKLGASFLIDPTTTDGQANIARIEEALDYAAIKTWKTKDKADKIRKTLLPARTGLRDGDAQVNSDGDQVAGYEGMMFVSASNRKRPKVLRRDKSVIDSTDSAEIYGGCYVNAVLSVWGTDQKKLGGNGLFFTLEIVQFVKDGEPFGAGPLNEDDYLDDLGDDEDDLLD